MPFSTTDTIVAIATPPGRGGIGVVRISGPSALAIARRITTHHAPFEPRHATFTRIRSAASRTRTVDHAIVTFFEAPHSYTGEHVVEVSVHGSPAILREVIAAAMARGARVAEPGEFTLRAFLNGRVDLMQAEAVADLVDAVTPLQARVAFDQLEGTLTTKIAEIDAALFDLVARLEASVDFPEEGYEFVAPADVAAQIDAIAARLDTLSADPRIGRLVREGARVSIVGRPNVGKSSVFNALVGVARAIVTDVPGTTRDLVTETLDIDGLKTTLVDTAGQRDTADEVEAIGVARARESQSVSDLILLVLDRSQRLEDIDRKLLMATERATRLIVANKWDLPSPWSIADFEIDPDRLIPVSALTGEGLDDLRTAIVSSLDRDNLREQPGITNLRHLALVDRARAALSRARTAVAGADAALPEEFVLADLQDARAALEEVVGRRTSDDVLAAIFSRFCIGK